MAMQYIFPLSKYLTITQGFKSSHLGIDFGYNSNPPEANGQAIIAAEAGTVKERADGYGNTYKSGNKIYGNYVIIDHGSNNYTVYGHMAIGVKVKVGQKVSKGQILGYMGNSGYSNGQHLHFEIRIGGYKKTLYAKDPLNYLAIEDPNLIISAKTDFPDRIKKRLTNVGTPVARDTTRDQVEVIASSLNARNKATTSGDRLGYVNKGIYNVLSRKSADGYSWCEIESGVFCAEKEGDWTKFYAKVVPAKYNVTFKSVSESDKTYLESIASSKKLTVESKKL